MSTQFLLRLSNYTNEQVERAAKKMDVSKTKFIEELIKQEFMDGAAEIVLLGPAGLSSVAWEFIDALKRQKDRVVGVIRVDSQEASREWHLVSYGFTVKDSQIVYAAIGVVSTGSKEGALAYQMIEDYIKQQNIPLILLPGPILYQHLPNTAISYVPQEAFSRIFSWGQMILKGGPQYAWQEEHIHEVNLGGRSYVIACRIELPQPTKPRGYVDIWAYEKEAWQRESQTARWMVSTARTEGKCMAEFDYEAKEAEIIDFLFSGGGYRKNHWNTGLAQEVLDLLEEHCKEFGLKTIGGDSSTFGHNNEYSLHAVPTLELKGYKINGSKFRKELDDDNE